MRVEMLMGNKKSEKFVLTNEGGLQQTDRGTVFLNQSNIDLNYGDVIKIYYLDNNMVENFIGIGSITHIQENQKICHIDFVSKKDVNFHGENVYFSLKINKDELNDLIREREE